MTNLLFIGDIVGRPGRDLLRHGLAALASHHNIDLIIANVENAAAGTESRPTSPDLLSTAPWMTGGNHRGQERNLSYTPSSRA